MKKRLINSVSIIVAVITVMANSMVAYAAPKTMSDGTTFDAEYYASANPDVVAAVGKGEEALYNHYVTYGKKEGRQPVAGEDTSAKTVSTNPEIVDKIAKAYSENDYVTIYNFSKNFASYAKELAPYMTAQASSQRYNFDTAYGKLILVHFSGDEYKSIVYMGLAFQDVSTGNAIAAKTNADNARRKANWGWNLCSHCVYGTDFLIQQDRWTEYVLCYNGCEYMEVSTDGKEYSSYKNYPDRPTGGQSASMHFCVG